MTVDKSNSVESIEYAEKNFDELSLEVNLTAIDNKSNNGEEKVVKSASWKKFAGISLTVLASLFFSLGNVIVKSIDEVSVSEMTTYRHVGKFFLPNLSQIDIACFIS